ncbi:MAG TPA: family 20 glycosylhydrolase [Lysobacter sp.]|nr:family 20 glycosylhydrolase [Lysobacter sp.]
MRDRLLAVVLAVSGGLATATSAIAATPSLIPWPARVEAGDGSFVLDGRSAVVVARGDAPAARAAQEFTTLLRRTQGITLKVETRPATARDIAFASDRAAPEGEEAYAVDVGDSGIRVRARGATGLYYGGITLWQLLTTDVKQGLPLQLPAMRIEDAPRFAWRGLMLDTARHFRTVDEIKQFLDWMALHKFNTFHWHLTDDQGWRLQIRRYPKLTEIGAWRTPAGAGARDAAGRPVRYGGFYTQAQAREIVAHAAARHITVVPEIEMPGHAQAAIASYPQLGVTGGRPPVSNGWGVSPYLFNIDDGTFAFLENVLDEVTAIFPGRYIHIGGDEAAKGQWENSPYVQQRMRELGIADAHALQSWFIKRIERHLSRHGRRLIGWDEILEGGLPPSATVMSWRGTAGAIEAARQGHDVVLSPGVPVYLDQKQGEAADEGPGQPALNTLRLVYGFEPVPPEVTEAEAKHVLGGQGNLWSEYMRTFGTVQRAAYPRAAALAEALWSPKAARDWDSFLARMGPQLQRYRSLGLAAADSAFAVRIALAPSGDASHVLATLSTQAEFGTLRYTVDGSEPGPQSPAYTAPLRLPLGGLLKAASFDGETRLSASRAQALDAAALRTRRSEQLRFCNGENGIRLEDDAPADGPRAVLHTQLGSVCLRWPQAPLDGMAAVRVQVGAVENTFMYGKPGDGEPKPVATEEPGELRVYRGECGANTPIAVLPLAPARGKAGISTLQAPIAPSSGPQDLCLRTENTAPDLTWAVNQVELLPLAMP